MLAEFNRGLDRVTAADLFPKAGRGAGAWQNWAKRSRPTREQLNRLGASIAEYWELRIRAWEEAWKEHHKSGDATMPDLRGRPWARGMDRLDATLEDLYNAAGEFLSIAGARRNRQTREVFGTPDGGTRRPLRIGVFEWPPMACPAHMLEGHGIGTDPVPVRSLGGDGVERQEEWRGLSLDIMMQCCGMLRVDCHFVRVDWPGVWTSLDTGFVDCIAPLYLRIPFMVKSVRFSRPLPHFRAILNGLCHTSTHRELLQSPETERRGRNPWIAKKMVFAVGVSPVGQTLGTLLDRAVKPEDNDKNSHHSITDGWKSLIERPRQFANTWSLTDNPARVFPTESLTVAYATKVSKDVEPLIPLSTTAEAQNTEVGLGVCMAVGTGEPALLNLLNMSLSEVSRHKSVLARLYAPYYQTFLRPAGALDQKFRNAYSNILTGTTVGAAAHAIQQREE